MDFRSDNNEWSHTIPSQCRDQLSQSRAICNSRGNIYRDLHHGTIYEVSKTDNVSITVAEHPLIRQSVY